MCVDQRAQRSPLQPLAHHAAAGSSPPAVPARVTRASMSRNPSARATETRWRPSTTYREGGDPARRIAALSTYLGHVDPGKTYWYLQAAPELMALAGRRLQRHLGAGQ